MLASTSPLWKVKCCTFSDTLTAAHLEKLVALFSQLHSLLLLRPDLVHHLRDQDTGAGVDSALRRTLAGELDIGTALPAKHHWVNIRGRTYSVHPPTGVLFSRATAFANGMATGDQSHRIDQDCPANAT